eukprot:1987364-Prymnesium_polylepis.1
MPSPHELLFHHGHHTSKPSPASHASSGSSKATAPAHASSAAPAGPSGCTASGRAPDWVEACKARGALHPARWDNCPCKRYHGIELHTLAARLIKALLALGGPLMMAGDSLMRDFFLAAACVQSPHAAALPKLTGMHFGTEGVLSVSTYFSTTTSFLWLDPPKWREAEWKAVNGSAL